MPEGIEFKTLDALTAALARLTGADLATVSKRAGYKIALEIRTKLTNKPGPSSQPVKWASRKQQIWWILARKKAGLDLKYKRNADLWSQKSSATWGIQYRRNETVLGNPATYAPHVYSDEYQTEQHAATGWTTDKEAVDAVFREGMVARHVMAEVHTLIQESFRGLR